MQEIIPLDFKYSFIMVRKYIEVSKSIQIWQSLYLLRVVRRYLQFLYLFLKKEKKKRKFPFR